MTYTGQLFTYIFEDGRERAGMVLVPGVKSSQCLVWLGANESAYDLTGESSNTPRLQVANDLIEPKIVVPQPEPAPLPPEPPDLSELTEADQDKIMKDALNLVEEIIEAAQVVELPVKGKK